MIGILRIISVAVTVLAVLVVASVLGPVSFFGSDRSREDRAAEILNSPDAVERFRQQGEAEAPLDQDTTPPLVRQAETLARIMNPPVETTAPVSSTPQTFTPKRVTPVAAPSAKFDLVGTSYCASCPEESFAYVRLPDNTYQWVEQGSVVGHLTVVEIKDGSIVYSDGQGRSEMMSEPTPDTAGLLETGGSAASTRAAVSQPSAPASTGGARERVAAARRAAAALTPSRSARLSDSDKKDMTALVKKLKEELQRSESDKTDPDSGPADKAAAMNRLISEFKSSRVSPEEAKRLEDLGKELNGTTEPEPGDSATGRRREFMRRLGALRSRK